MPYLPLAFARWVILVRFGLPDDMHTVNWERFLRPASPAGNKKRGSFRCEGVRAPECAASGMLLEPVFTCLSIMFDSRYQKGDAFRSSGTYPFTQQTVP